MKDYHVVTLNDPYYPPLLKEISLPPPILHVKGNLEVLSSPQIAIVGSRNPTPGGRELAYDFAQQLGKVELTITSGLAIGIDEAAHRGGLSNFQTIAVLGCGINIIYPRANKKLAEEIAKNGAIVSIFPIDSPPLREHFPQRNRIISALSLGTLVVEAALRSGSLITAQFAAEQGREVFAIPGSINNSLARGCHHLIRQGAKLVETVEDIFDELNLFSKKEPDFQLLSRPSEENKLEEDHIKLLECVAYEPTDVGILVARSGFSVQKVASLLLDLQLQGYIVHSLCGGYTRSYNSSVYDETML